MINIIIDVIIAALLLIGFVVGIKRGFVKSVARPFKFVAALIIAFSFAASVGEAVVEPIIADSLNNKIAAEIEESFSSVEDKLDEDKLPTVIKVAAGLCDLDVDELIKDADGSEAKAIADALTEPVVSIFATIIAFILLYIASKIALALALAILSSLADKGLIGSVNKLLGCIFSVALMFIVCWGFVSVFDFVIHLPSFENAAWLEGFTGGYLYNFFKTMSPMELLLSF